MFTQEELYATHHPPPIFTRYISLSFAVKFQVHIGVIENTSKENTGL